MIKVYLLLGTNIGDRLQHLQDACSLLSEYTLPEREETNSGEDPAIKIIRQSAVYETAAWGKIEQADYLNQAVQISTSLDPRALLTGVSSIETRLGRTREKIWGPRIIDIDILFYGRDIIREDKLVIPHPHLQDRRFVLAPLAEIAPGFIHPVLKKSIAGLLKVCADPLWVREYNPALRS
jgi:2-amino-4-hydroxy-6-hydroxymethyldihydropteridine diphosphokinase